jgi:hypothetical protein
MSEPFDIHESPDVTQRSAAQAKPTFWDQTVTACKSLWKQTLIIARRGETVVQLPLVLAIVLVVGFPHLAALVLVLGIVLGYSFTVAGK